MIAILRKDLRRLWPHVLIFWLLLALSAWLDPVYSGRMFTDDFKPITFIIVLACATLIISAIQQEAVPGDRQYWLTRPIGRSTLLTAKLCFIALFILLPTLAAQFIIYSAVGIPVGDHFAALLWRQFFFVAFLILPTAALAAVTHHLGQSILGTVLLVAVVFAIGVSEIFRFVIPITIGPFAGYLLKAILCAAGAAAVFYLQYSRRATLASLAVMATTGVLVFLTFRTELPLPPKPSEVFLKLEPLTNAGPPAPLLSLEFPVRLDDLPPSLDITVEDLKIGLGEVDGPRPLYLRPFEGSIRRGGAGGGWLTVFGAYQVLYRYLTDDLRFHAQMSLVLSKPGITLPRPGKAGIVVPAFGRCQEGHDSGESAIVCYSPLARTSLALQFPSGARRWILSLTDYLNPLPSPLGFQTLDRYTADAEDLTGVRLVTGTVVERRIATLDFQSVPLVLFIPAHP